MYVANLPNISFYALVFGKDEGCDYSIACNKDIWELKAGTLEEALVEVRKRMSEYIDQDSLLQFFQRVEIVQTLHRYQVVLESVIFPEETEVSEPPKDNPPDSRRS